MNIKIALLIPTYNEAVSIVGLLDKLAEFRANKSSNFDVIVIDDNSPDGTANIVDKGRDANGRNAKNLARMLNCANSSNR